jgi:formylglycine-generating enzyme required for sulfatase activity
MGKYPVTQGLYQAVMGVNPSYFKTPIAPETSTARRPVEQVSWYETLVFCNKLSMLSNLTPVYRINGSTAPSVWGAVPNGTWDAVEMDVGANGYRLPTEVEWEYACRAGTTTPFSTGDNITAAQANYNGKYPYNSPENPAGVYLERTTEVGSYDANAWGLYDMHGNVREWCWDWFEAAYGETIFPPETLFAHIRVTRGGSWINLGERLRSAYRFYNSPMTQNYTLGFRLVRT